MDEEVIVGALIGRKSTHWIGGEVDRLGSCWCNVSTEKGGPGSGHKLTGMWKKIGVKYHEQNPPPPIPVDAQGHICDPRNVVALTSKWKRIKPMFTVYMKCEMLAIANPRSGESMLSV